MYNYNPKRYLIKNIIYITIILLIAVVSTYKIYYKFQDDRDVNYNSESFVVTFHENTGAKMTLDTITPVTDSVGLSSKAYNFSIKNNLTENVAFKVKVVDDEDTIEDDDCLEKSISKDNIRISIKNGDKSNKIYTLSELYDDILFSGKMNALEEREISIRIWIDKNSSLPTGSDMHYHGIIQVIEENGTIAINK